MRRSFGHSTVPCALALFVFGGCGGSADESAVQVAAPAAPASRFSPLLDAEKQSAPKLPASAPTVAHDEVPIREQIAQLRREVVAINLQLARMPLGQAPAEIAHDPQTEEAARVEAERVVVADVQSREASFRVEPVDAAWSRSFTESLRGALSLANGRGTEHVQSIECRSRSCRVVVDAAAAEAAGQDVPAAFAQLAQKLPNVTVGPIDIGDGRNMTVVYLSP